ncbi:type VII secretion-associated protein [Mycobacterium sp. NPDC003323]
MTVVVAGPGTVHGSRPVPADLAETACAAIDDPYAIVDARFVDVDELWRTVLRTATGGAPPEVLICPGWWHPARIDRIRRAAPGKGHVVRQRHHCHPAPGHTVVEIAAEFVLVHDAGRTGQAVPRLGDTAATSEAVMARVGAAVAVLVDAPLGVPGAAQLAAAVAARVRSRGGAVTVVDDHTLLREATPPARAPRRHTHRIAATLAAAALPVAGFLVPRTTADVEPTPAVLVTEGAVAVRVPDSWSAVRVVAGGGSPRLQLTSPEHPDAAILLTQSPVAPDWAAVLAATLAAQPAGVFVDFDHPRVVAGREVAAYTEIRTGRAITWAVFVDGPVRIAIGCQQPAQRPDLIRGHCDEAIRSARRRDGSENGGTDPAPAASNPITTK